MENKLSWWFVYEWEKLTRQKLHRVIFRSPLPKFHYYHNKRLQVNESQYLIPTYSWTLTPILNWTCSVVTVPISNARLPSTWLTVARIPVRDFNNTNWEDCWLQSSSVHPHNEDQEDVWSQNPTMQIHSNFFKRKRWTRSRTLSPITICLNKVCSMLVQLVYSFTALKTILLYV